MGEDFGGNRFHFFGRVCRLLGPTGEHLLAIHLYILSASTIIIEIFTFPFSLYIGVSGVQSLDPHGVFLHGPDDVIFSEKKNIDFIPDQKRPTKIWAKHCQRHNGPRN